jgi:TPR repeat protein
MYTVTNMDTITSKLWRELTLKAKQGDAESQCDVGYYFENGAIDASHKPVVKANRSAARQWYTRAATQGDSWAQLSLSNLLSTGPDRFRNYPESIHWAKKAVNQHNASAAQNLGTVYRDMKKMRLAFRWYQRAVDMGNKESLLNLGLCHLFAAGTTRDVDAAEACLKQILRLKTDERTQRTFEHALYWIATLQLMGVSKRKNSIAQIRKMLQIANTDSDHEQANEVLLIIGRSA